MKEQIKRSENLKKKLNLHLNRLVNSKDKDYYSSIHTDDLINLKMLLSDINNILTLKLTEAAIQWLSKYFDLSNVEKESLLSETDKINPNSNGFDIKMESTLKILAEVKCNVPASEGNRYMAAQRNSILDDALKLINGKGSLEDPTDYYKFIFLLNLGEKSDEAINALLTERNTRSANPLRINRNNVVKKMVLLTDEKPESLNKQSVYLVSIVIQ